MFRTGAGFCLVLLGVGCGSASETDLSASGSGGVPFNTGGSPSSAGGKASNSGGNGTSSGGANSSAGGNATTGSGGANSNASGGTISNTGGSPSGGTGSASGGSAGSGGNFSTDCPVSTEGAASQNGTTTNVASMAALQAAINQAVAGDTLVLADGTYNDSFLTIDKSGITVRAQTPGGVVLGGTSGADKDKITITGSNVTFSGFQFKAGDIGARFLVEVTGSHNLLTQLNFSGYFAQKYIHFNQGEHNELSCTNIENKPAAAQIGAIVQITTSATTSGYHLIRNCSFQNMPGPGHDNGNEPIRIGLGAEIGNVSRTIVEHNLFDNVYRADAEIVSVKSDENIIRYNTFANNSGLDAQNAPIWGGLVFRLTHRSVAYGNFFLNGGGIRAKEGGGHSIYNNYFDTGTSEAITLQYVDANPLMNITIAHNTFVNTGTISLGTSGPTGIVFANNIFTKTTGNIFAGATGTETWLGNIYQGATGIGPNAGLTSADPLLALNADGYYGLGLGSPAIDAAVAGYPALLDIDQVDDDPSVALDIAGQARPASGKDVGADEYGSESPKNRPLKLADVGPSYLRAP